MTASTALVFARRFFRANVRLDKAPVLGWHPVGNLRLGNWGVPLAGAWELEVITSEVALSSEPGWRNSAKPAGEIPCAAMALSIFEPNTGHPAPGNGWLRAASMVPLDIPHIRATARCVKYQPLASRLISWPISLISSSKLALLMAS